MSAGKGITHSEFNASNKEIVHLLQIWIIPGFHLLRHFLNGSIDKTGYPPSYQQIPYNENEKLNGLKLLVSNDGQNNSVEIHQDAKMYASVIENRLNYKISPVRSLATRINSIREELLGFTS
jgi:redox-sensitive bicupin YhaK (pirin superfamily)